jgi:osmotically-inducible protein OsmY
MKQTDRGSERKMAADITSAIQCITTIPTDSLRVTVNEDWVCLRGALNEPHQKEVAEEVVRQFSGVRGVTNLITITPHAASQN